MDFREPIVVLTAVHFHYTGFATALVAGAMVDFAQRHGLHSRTRSALVVLVLSLPFVLAAGFVFSPTIKVCAAVLLSITMLGLAVSQLGASRSVSRSDGHVFLWISSAAVVVAMALAATYAVGDFLGKSWISIPGMASTHGLLNALGFVLPALVGWLVAWLGEGRATRSPTALSSIRPRWSGFSRASNVERDQRHSSRHWSKYFLIISNCEESGSCRLLPTHCPDACGVLITIDDGRAVKVQGDPAHPVTRGFLCAKVAKYLDRVYSPDRVLYPMRRVAPKGVTQPTVGVQWRLAADFMGRSPGHDRRSVQTNHPRFWQ